MHCSISGEVPDEPVVSRKSGLVFEKRLIERHISDNGKCPVTGEAMNVDDIISLKSGKILKPRPIAAASIPGMLGMFQIEWDALMLSNMALEKQLHMARQELSHALYQHDAACRVISRLKKDRDEARALLAEPERQLPVESSARNTTHAPENSNGKRAAEDASSIPGGKKHKHGIASDIVDELSEYNALVSKQRKKRTKPQTLANVEDVENYTQLSSHPLHKTSNPGILSIDIYHSKVTSVKIVPQDDPFVITGSADTTVRLWKSSESGNYECKYILENHHKAVKGVAIHPSNKYFATASLDNTWCFYNLSSGLCHSQVTDPSSLSYTSAAFHPDGFYLGTGTSNSLARIWDLRSQDIAATLDGHAGAVTSISCSENGYVVATSARDGVKLLDLRYVKNFQSFSPYDPSVSINSVDFDHSGSYVAFGGEDIRVYKAASIKKEWNCIKTLHEWSGAGKVTSLKFGADAKYIAVGSMDRNLGIFGLHAAENA